MLGLMGRVGRPGLAGAGASAAVANSPSLDIAFTTGVLDSRVTFTRASTGTYFDVTGTLQSASSNVARFDYDPVTHTPLGLLIEEQRVNLATQSVTLSTWIPTNVTAVNASGIAPDGTNSFTRLVETATTNFHTITFANVVAGGSNYTFSAYAKAAENRYLILNYDDGGGTNTTFVTFDLQTGTISQAAVAAGTATASGASIIPVGNGVYRCSLIASIATGTARAALTLTNVGNPGTNYPIYAGNASNGLLVWGAQLELGAFPTSYIPTGGASVTRSTDIASISPLGAWFNNSAFSYVATVMEPVAVGVAPVFMQFDDTTANNRTVLSGTAAGLGNYFESTGGVTTLNQNLSARPVGTSYTIGGRTASGMHQASISGGAPVGNTNAAAPPTVTLVRFRAIAGNGAGVYYMRRVRVWPRLISSAELQAATAQA